MKFFIAVILCACALNSAHCLSKEQKLELAKAMIIECKDKESASNDDVSKLLSENLPESPEGQCMLACLNEKMGFVSLLIKVENLE